MYTGSCLCGAVRYRYDGEIDTLSMCHCRECQKAQGAAFVAVAPLDAADFHLVSGGETLKRFASSPGKWRVFCGNCGSPLWSERQGAPETKRLRVGTLDTPIAPTTAFHAYVPEKAAWFVLNDGLPQYATFPPSR